MPELLIEIMSEEIPARMQVRAGEDLSKALVDGLKKAGLSVEDVKVWTGPRRIGFCAKIPVRSPDISEERKGPRVGAPEQALAGFMRGAGLSDISEAHIKTDKKGDFYVALITMPGRDASDIVAELLPNVMTQFPWPKSMKSGTSTFRWVRPLVSLIMIIDGDIVPVTVGGIDSGDMTEGHRLHGRGPFKISSYADYQTTLEGEGHVWLSHAAREKKILTHARALCKEAGLELVEDTGLLSEVAGLAEWPVIILGDMDPRFLELPSEVIRLSMRVHQKYFAVKDPKTGELAPHFIVVANQDAPDGGKAIAQGNSRVLSARLSDALFFQQEDAKKNLINYYDKLDTVMFHKKLGSVRDKAERVAALSRELAPIVGADADAAEQAAKLAKCDLVTQTVIEFTSLQGQIGRLIYEREGGDTTIAIAIEDHYKPQGPSDDVPTDPVAVTVALADKLDTLVGFWAIDEKPTGSKDPYALRRAALGVVRIILENEIRFISYEGFGTFSDWIERAMLPLTLRASVLLDTSQTQEIDSPIVDAVSRHALPISEEERQEVLRDLTNLSNRRLTEGGERFGRLFSTNLENSQDLLSFIIDRLKVYLRDKGVRHDLIDAVFALGEDDLVAIVNRVEALQEFLATQDGENLLAGYKRASNILKAEEKKGELPDVSVGPGTQAEETALYEGLKSTEKSVNASISREDYMGAMTALAELRAPIDAFFDQVMVNSDDAGERANRLGLLQHIETVAGQVADFSKIEG